MRSSVAIRSVATANPPHVLVADIDPGTSDQNTPYGFIVVGTNRILLQAGTAQFGQSLGRRLRVAV